MNEDPQQKELGLIASLLYLVFVAPIMMIFIGVVLGLFFLAGLFAHWLVRFIDLFDKPE